MRVRKVVRHILLCHIDLRKCESKESGASHTIVSHKSEEV